MAAPVTRLGRWPYTRYWYLHRSRVRWPRYFTAQLFEPAIVLTFVLSLAFGAGVLSA